MFRLEEAKDGISPSHFVELKENPNEINPFPFKSKLDTTFPPREPKILSPPILSLTESQKSLTMIILDRMRAENAFEGNMEGRKMKKNS